MQRDPADESACYDKAIRLLASRSHFVRQLEQKLSRRGFDAAVVERVLERLSRDGTLDDRRVAEEYVRGRLRRGLVGRRRMWLELARRGAEASAADGALDTVYADIDEGEATREVAAAWCRRGRRDPAALARHLDRKGFPAGAILEVVEERRGEWSDESG
ncbi:MAG: regulatory protein RecX [Thermoanaerobaculia bacterium]|nr:regulatory protein RecX [Thermoanaerobaculia bacterium]